MPEEVKVVGLSRTATRELMGSPDSELDRPPAKVWRYQGQQCSVEIFFFMDVSKGDFYALRTTPARDSGRCLAQISGERKGRS